MSDSYSTMLQALHDGTLPAAEFTHRHHIGVAVAALRHYPFFQALWVVADGLQNLASRAGVPEKFNATITLASMSLVAEHLADHPDMTADQLMDTYPDLLSLDLIRSLYVPERLTSDLAKQTGLLPLVTEQRGLSREPAGKTAMRNTKARLENERTEPPTPSSLLILSKQKSAR